MTNIKEGTKPVSKYAAKKAARAKAAMEEVANSNEETVKDAGEVNNTEKPKAKKFFKGKFDATERYPEHIVQLVLIMKNNAEIRRFTALGIINCLLQKGEIRGTKRYVVFKWNKFTVVVDGLSRDYAYTEPFFINALVASFASFSAAAQRTIDNFCKKEIYVGFNKAADKEEIEKIVSMNEQHQNELIENEIDDTDK